MATDYTPYQERPARGAITTVIASGRRVIDGGELLDPEPRGRPLASKLLFKPGSLS